jgi:two-component system LytT family response regulator
VQFLRTTPVDLVLLDIKLPDGTGFDVVRQVGPDAMPPVVFVTAYDSHAIEAFEVNAVDYLLKPFDEARLKKSIDRVVQRISNPENLVSQLRDLLDGQKRSWAKRIVVRDGEQIRFVPVSSIDWIESANNYVVLHCGEKTHVHSETLSSIESRLDPQTFLRIHRRRIVNVSRIIALSHMSGGVYEVELRDGVKLQTGRQFRDKLQTLIRETS